MKGIHSPMARIPYGGELRIMECFKVDIDRTDRRIILRMPSPKILSNEVDLRLVDVDNGIAIKIDKYKYNRVFAKAKNETKLNALRKGILRRAKTNAYQVIGDFLRPFQFLNEYRIDFRLVFPGDEELSVSGARPI